MNILKSPRREVHFDEQDGDSGDRHKSLTESAFKVPGRQGHQIASTHDTSTHQAWPNTPGKFKSETDLNSHEPLLK